MINETNQLSEREREILRLVATGLSNQQIANQLGISINTVKVHLRNVFGKIGVASRTEATMYAVRSGIVAVAPAEQPAADDVAPADASPVIERAAMPLDAAPLDRAEPAGLLQPAPPVTLPPAPPAPPAPLDDVVRAAPPAAPSVERATPRARPMRWAAIGIVGLILLGIVVGATAQALGWVPGARVQPSPTSDPVGVAASGSGEQRRWTELAPLPEPRAAFAIANIADQLYVIGGENSAGVLGSVQRYDVRVDAWVALSSKPTPVADVRAAVLGEKIYVPGGRTSADPAAVVNTFERYDPRTESWERLPDLPAPRSAYALATAEGRLYLFGGWDGARYRNEVFAYDPGSATWRTLTPMPTARAYMDAAVVDAGIYLLGGENESGPLPANELYFPAREGDQPWVRRPPMPSPRSRFGAVGVSSPSIIYVIGGSRGDQEPLQYSPDTDRWQPIDPPAEPIGSLPGVIQQDVSIITVGGMSSPTSYTATMQRYQALYTIPLPGP